jgi:hypothetical protein
MRCSICETELSERALFCEVCGNRVRRDQRAPSDADVRGMAARAPVPRPRGVPVAAAGTVSVATRQEVETAIATREELGATLEPEVIDAFLARIESAVVTRVDQELAVRLSGRTGALARAKRAREVTLPVAICSLVFGIPLSAIAAGTTGLSGLIVCWLGIAGVNAAVNLTERQKDEGRR